MKAKELLSENHEVLYGAFSTVSNIFPTFEILNDFFRQGKDSCDQDERMKEWKPFELNLENYLKIVNWWKEKYPQTIVDSLGTDNWEDWFVELQEKLEKEA
ncbi:MAG: hypothetical protein NE327_16690 [Lentisphaeraceae bacterium]|nr:hypothetical protein [Lentisphaeraceae bacterium]